MEPLRTLLDNKGKDNILTDELTALYGGPLSFPAPENKPYTLVNFVTTLEGITSFNEPGHMGGGDISGFNPQDTFIMGLLRAVADGVAVGANTLRLEPKHLWTPEFISKEHAALYEKLRKKLKKISQNPLNIFVSGSGKILSPDMKDDIPDVFTNPDIKTAIVTTKMGKFQIEKEFNQRKYPCKSDILVFGSGWKVDLEAAMKHLKGIGIETLLIEGGAGFNGSMMDAGLVDELFLTRAPQVVGYTKEDPRPLFASGFSRSPGGALWFKLLSVKSSGDYLYERFRRK